MGKFLDVSVSIENGMPHWPGDPDVNIYRIGSIAGGNSANISAINFGLHTGTHMDAPLHFIDQAADITMVTPEILIGKTKVIEINNPEFIGREELEEYDLKNSERILFKTRNSSHEWFKEEFNQDYVYLNDEGAEYLSGLKVRVIGIDYLSIGKFKAGKDTHQTLLKKNIWIIEGLYLKDVPEGDYEMYAMPLKISGADGSPVRVILKQNDYDG